MPRGDWSSHPLVYSRLVASGSAMLGSEVDAASGGGLRRREGLAVWTLESPSVVEIGYVLVTQGPRGRAAVPDGRCGLGLVDGVP